MQITNSASTQQPRAKEKEEKERIDVGQCQVVESIGNQGKEQEEMAFFPFPFFQRAITFTFLPLSHFGKDTDGPLINDKVGNSTASGSSACVLFVMVVVELQRKQKKRTRVLHCCFCCCCCSSC